MLLKQNPTWSEDDEKMSENILSHLREYYVQKKGYPYVADVNSPEMEEFRWFKTFKDRMKGERVMGKNVINSKENKEEKEKNTSKCQCFNKPFQNVLGRKR